MDDQKKETAIRLFEFKCILIILGGGAKTCHKYDKIKDTDRQYATVSRHQCLFFPILYSITIV